MFLNCLKGEFQAASSLYVKLERVFFSAKCLFQLTDCF